MKIHPPAATRPSCCSPCDVIVLHVVGATDDNLDALEVWAYPATFREARLARRFARIVRHLAENPSLIPLLAGVECGPPVTPG